MASANSQAFQRLGLVPDKTASLLAGIELKVTKILERRTRSKEALRLAMAHLVRRLWKYGAMSFENTERVERTMVTLLALSAPDVDTFRTASHGRRS